MISSQQDPPLRIVTIGDASVGKTSITNRLTDTPFNEHESSTIGANYLPYTAIVNSEAMEIQIWDTAGQEKFKSLTPIYFRSAIGAIAIFSLTDVDTFKNIENWIKIFKDTAGSDSIVYVCANKCDCVDEIHISFDEIKDWAKEKDYKLFVTSAKTDEGIHEMFESLCNDLYEWKIKKDAKPRAEIHPIKAEKKGCC